MTQIIHAPHARETTLVADGCDWLEVRRGRTQFPCRPLTSGRFLIGSGTNCHVQLGGGMPMLHTLLTQEREGWVAEAIAPEPRLFVNGQECRWQALCIDDVLRIGELEFAVRRGPRGERDADAFDEHGAPRVLDRVLHASDLADADALVLSREPEASPINPLDVQRIPLAYPLRRAVQCHDATLRQLASFESNEHSQLANPEHAAPHSPSRVA